MATAAKKAPMKRPMKEHMKEEMSTLKKGGASKKLMSEEKAEYAAKGYKMGGKVGMKGKRR